MPSVTDQSLFQATASIDDIYQVINNTVFKSHNNIQVSKSDIRVHNSNPFSHGRQPGPDICYRSGFTHAAFSGCNDNDLTHIF